jgi:hypothetical protein
LWVVVDRLVPLAAQRDDRGAGDSGGDVRGGRVQIRRALGAERQPDRHGDIGEPLDCAIGADRPEFADGGKCD